MIQRFEGGMTYYQTFDAENRLISVTVNYQQTTQFKYDDDGNPATRTPSGVRAGQAWSRRSLRMGARLFISRGSMRCARTPWGQ
jgi:YD repeat-containing protein